MDWFGQDVPPEWQWISLFLAVIGTILAVFGIILTAFQMLLGKPKLELEFTTREIEHSRGLVCRIQSPPVDNRFLTWLGVYRRATEGVSAFVSIIDKRTGNEVSKYRAGVRTGYGEHTHDTTTINAAQIDEAFFPIVIAFPQDVRIYMSTDYSELPTIMPGEYTVRVGIFAAEQRWLAKRDFHVGEQPYDLYWC